MRDAPAVVSGGQTTKGEEQTGGGDRRGTKKEKSRICVLCLEARLKERDDTVAMDDIVLDECCGGSFVCPPTPSFS